MFERVLEHEIHTDDFPSSNSRNTRGNATHYTVESLASKNTAYTNFTGRLHYQSSRGNEYIMVAWSYGENAILSRPIN